KLLLDSNVEVNALSVVNDYSVQFPEEIYESHKLLGLNYMQFIPCLKNDGNDNELTTSFSISPKKYGEFLCKLFDLWQADFVAGSPTTSIRYFDSVLYIYAGLHSSECTFQQYCGDYLVVEHNGDVFSCDFYVEPKWKLGNIMHDNLFDLLNSKRQNEFGRMKAMIPNICKQCKWLKFCRGGCMKDRLRVNSSEGMNYYCESYKMFFEYADIRLQKLTTQLMSLRTKSYK
ncbi:MAG TPA: SPASM domain-containing protein, partial [Ignavibacteria bacterium]|nr:SPASM domain-containing protein [Ignavibacteria bacterium]